MQLITQYLNSYATVAASSDPNLREAFGTHLVDLLMLIVGADRDTHELIEGRGLKAARTKGILEAIARHFAVPNFTADGVGLDLGITGRQVHRLLEETTKTFYEHLLERRLIEAHKLLTSPACSTLNVAEIARRAGFIDRTHFHRVFRIRFGGTPMDVRTAAARENAGRFVQGSPKRSSTLLGEATGRARSPA
jgi:transcriptional regulator GlxA family with amidase domain